MIIRRAEVVIAPLGWKEAYLGWSHKHGEDTGTFTRVWIRPEPRLLRSALAKTRFHLNCVFHNESVLS